MPTTRRWLAVAGVAVAIGGVALIVFAARCGMGGPGPVPAEIAWTPPSWTRELDVAKAEAMLLQVDLLLWFHDRRRELEWEGSPSAAPDDLSMLGREVFADDHGRRFLQQGFRIVELQYSSAMPVADAPRELAGLGSVLYGTSSNGRRTDMTRETFFPEVVLADADGRPYAVPRPYLAGDGAAFADELLEMRSVRERRDEAFAAAARTEGLERAKALAAGLAALAPAIVQAAYLDEVGDILDLDPEGEAGLLEQYQRIERLAEVAPAVLAVDDLAFAAGSGIAPRRLKDVLAPVVRAHPGVTEVEQVARLWVVVAEGRLALDDHDFAAIARDLEAVKAIDPESLVVARIDEVLLQVAEQRAALRK